MAAILGWLLVAAEDGRLAWPAVAVLLGLGVLATAAIAAAVRRWGRSGYLPRRGG